MRQGTNSRRSRGRGRKQPSGGGGGRFNTFDSNGPQGRLRGNAHQLYEKYLGLARDATGSGDRVTAENLFQHADHYFRVMSANSAEQSSQRRVNGDGQQPDLREGETTQEAAAEHGNEQPASNEEPATATEEQPPAKRRAPRRVRAKSDTADDAESEASPKKDEQAPA